MNELKLLRHGKEMTILIDENREVQIQIEDNEGGSAFMDLTGEQAAKLSMFITEHSGHYYYFSKPAP